jgi:peptidylprolyl isomerase
MIKKRYIGLLVVAVLSLTLFSACSSTPQVAKAGDKVKVDYTGKLTDGTVFDSSVGKTPLEFTVGDGNMIKGFDAAVVGMKVGESKTVTLSPDLAYGQRVPDITINRSQLDPSIKPVVGGTIQNSSGATAVITGVTDTSITIDTNGPLAGKTLIFEIKLISISN